ncbi:hypothetical protein BDK51DRAFT_51599 [Blyttiomyces helicus]|uniref:Cyclin N-terminal domain-containing protein n=1 Tax=Blyttiomyces helicus TaxID=388810 RepID=A0A4P9WLL9_9FUNG|nr:hypothetical protein BDK51DRAFT_51599 [Blyttiomyces helicus]|eukprot:RKO92030.1 hypothetical protein BDK51DRAFT_51599 [Blyttiomyces helicus]
MPKADSSSALLTTRPCPFPHIRVPSRSAPRSARTVREAAALAPPTPPQTPPIIIPPAPQRTPPSAPKRDCLESPALLGPACADLRCLEVAATFTLRLWFRAASPPSDSEAPPSPISPTASAPPFLPPCASLFPLAESPTPTPTSPAPATRLRSFTLRALQSTRLSTHTLFFALLLLARLAHASRRSPFRPESGAEVRLLGIALLLADAAINDQTVSVRSWARLMDLSAREVVTMKTEFLKGIGFDVSLRGYETFLKGVMVPLLREVANRRCGVMFDTSEPESLWNSFFCKEVYVNRLYILSRKDDRQDDPFLMITVAIANKLTATSGATGNTASSLSEAAMPIEE